MKGNKSLQNQFILHIIYNMFTFTIIFLCLGLFLLFAIKKITFSNIDRELLIAKKEFIEANNILQKNNDFEKLENKFIEFEIDNFSIFDNRNINRRISNPQVTLFLRDSNGNIINNDSLLNKFQTTDIYFDSKNLNSIYDLVIDNKYNYRAINFEFSNNSDTQYVQLLYSSDNEIWLLSKYSSIIMNSVILGIILSIIASIVLSKKTLSPISDILEKQTEFIQNASHELRTPLTIIQAKQELLLQEPDSKIIDKSEEIMLTLEETKRLTKLTKDLTLLVKNSDLKPENIQKEDIEFDDFVRKIVTPYIEIAKLQEKELSLNLNFNKDLSIDQDKIHQLFVILIDNALKYTEKNDKISINTYLKDNKCIIEVCDTGIGINPENLSRVFDRFYREDKARSRETGGSGLGLSIANTIVSLHNGTIKASSNSPKGTIFTVKLSR